MKKRKVQKFNITPCSNCRHPKGIHHPVCWSYGLIEPKCRKHCQRFVRKNEQSRKKH